MNNIAPIGYEGMNRRGKTAKVSVQATHAYEPDTKNIGSFCPLKYRIFSRKIILKEICPAEAVSSTKADFGQLAKKFPAFKEELTFLKKLQSEIENCPFIRWNQICLGYKLDRTNPHITLGFVAPTAEAVIQAKNFVDALINEVWA